jgi:hypothetical protein
MQMFCPEGGPMRATLFFAILAMGGFGILSAQQPAAPQGQGQGGWQGQRGGRGMGGGFGGGRGTAGTVTEVAADHYTIKTELGEIYTIRFSVNTRIMKQAPGGGGQRRGQEAGRNAGQSAGQGGSGQGSGNAEDGGPRTPPQPIKATDIKVGDVIVAGGEVDASTKSVGAVGVMLIDPERAKEMRAMEANFGKTWLAGRVTAINEAKVILEGGPDHATHAFVADENTTFRKRRDPITLPDVQIGDMVRAEGAIKDGTFVATSVVVMGPPPNGARGAGGAPETPASAPQ